MWQNQEQIRLSLIFCRFWMILVVSLEDKKGIHWALALQHPPWVITKKETVALEPKNLTGS